MRLLALALVFLIAALQWPLWAGKGGWARVWELDRQLEAQQRSNDAARARNVALAAEIRDLKTGFEAIEERARSELGMIRADEVFFQVLETAPSPPAPAR
jgi:cell division protein FtsB